jgi:hypothetical protein
MYLVVNANGKYWNGIAWAQRGKEFLSVPAAMRSLCEEGEDFEDACILEKEEVE